MKKELYCFLSLIDAQSRVLQKLDRSKKMTSCASSAGFTTGTAGREYQVFVKAIRYDEQLLKRKPITGGLLAKP